MEDVVNLDELFLEYGALRVLEVILKKELELVNKAQQSLVFKYERTKQFKEMLVRKGHATAWGYYHDRKNYYDELARKILSKWFKEIDGIIQAFICDIKRDLEEEGLEKGDENERRTKESGEGVGKIGERRREGKGK